MKVRERRRGTESDTRSRMTLWKTERLYMFGQRNATLRVHPSIPHGMCASLDGVIVHCTELMWIACHWPPALYNNTILIVSTK